MSAYLQDIHSAAFSGVNHAIKYHLKRSSLDIVKSRNGQGETPLMCAIQGKNLRALELILDYLDGTDHEKSTLNASDSIYQWTSLHWIADIGTEEIFGLFFDRKRAQIISIDAKDVVGATPLHHAIRLDNKPIIYCLVEQGANINEQDNWGLTPLHYAYKYNNEQSIDLLLESGADKTKRDFRGRRPIDMKNFNKVP